MLTRKMLAHSAPPGNGFCGRFVVVLSRCGTRRAGRAATHVSPSDRNMIRHMSTLPRPIWMRSSRASPPRSAASLPKRSCRKCLAGAEQHRVSIPLDSGRHALHLRFPNADSISFRAGAHRIPGHRHGPGDQGRSCGRSRSHRRAVQGSHRNRCRHPVARRREDATVLALHAVHDIRRSKRFQTTASMCRVIRPTISSTTSCASPTARWSRMTSMPTPAKSAAREKRTAAYASHRCLAICRSW